jgi:hypothetical protein
MRDNTIKSLLVVVMVLCSALSSYALYYGVPVAIEGDNTPGVTVMNGETPFPTNAVFPVPYALRQTQAKYLKIVDGAIVERSAGEKAFVDLSLRYKIHSNGVWVAMSATDMTALDTPDKYKHEDGTVMDAVERAAADAAAAEVAEIKRQAAKSTDYKRAENAYLTICDQLTLSNTHTKLGFPELTAIITAMPAEQSILFTIPLLTLDAQLKREGGNKWWDDCVWHPEIVE